MDMTECLSASIKIWQIDDADKKNVYKKQKMREWTKSFFNISQRTVEFMKCWVREQARTVSNII